MKLALIYVGCWLLMVAFVLAVFGCCAWEDE